MNVLCFYLGIHDSNILLFCEADASFRYIKSEREFYIKRHRADLDWVKAAADRYSFAPDIVAFSDGNRNSLGSPPQDMPVQERLSSDFSYFATARWFNVDHHLAHCLSVWPMVDTSELNFGVAIDGRGDNDRRISIFKSPSLLRPAAFTASTCRIGHLFDLIGQKMGLKGLLADHAGKIMGLQAYGTADENLRARWLASGVYEDTFSLVREAEQKFGAEFFNPNEQRFRDWLATVHSTVEQLILRLFQENVPQSSRVSYAGGCALNTVINNSLSEMYPHLVVPPHAYDGGLSIGIYEAVRIKFGWPKVPIKGFPFIQNDTDFGYASAVSIERTAHALNEGKIVGWLQGKGEVGPRALGHRSLLLNPSLRDGKERINQVKRREDWRPFAPSILPEARSRYLRGTALLDYMLSSVIGTETADMDLYACMHADKSCRAQVVNSKRQPELETFELLIRKFAELSGIQGVMNTSFNEGGKPIVSTRNQAIDFFKSSPIDVLLIGDEFISK